MLTRFSQQKLILISIKSLFNNESLSDFYYKISEVGDTVDLKNKEYTKITGVTIPTSVAGEFYEVTKLVENLPAFDAIIFKIVFLGDAVGTNLAQTPKCRNLRIVALA